jgi:holo-[acyl-carrier-protein] synthase
MFKVIGVGIDITSVQRISDAISRHGPRLTRRLINSSQVPPRVESVAARWALREAAFKASLGSIPFHQLRVEQGMQGVPQLVPVESVRFMTSVSHDGGVAVAVAVAMCDR